MFKIVCNDIRQMYAQKFRDIQEKEINMIAMRAKEENTKLTFTFREMTNKVMNPPKDIDELNDIKNFINSLGVGIKKKQAEIEECMNIYKILEEFNYQFTNVEQNAKWELFGAPQRLVKCIEATSQHLDKEKERMIKQMEAEQEQFEDDISGLTQTVA